MKTENMKLLDLQIGKYLEVGEDFYYGGDHIVVNKCNVGYQIYEAIQHKDSERLSIDNKDCPFAAEPPLELKEICEKVGAVVYGGRYVLLTKAYNVKTGDLWNSSKYWNVLLACINYRNNIHFKHNISGGSVPSFEFIRDDNNDNLIVRCSQNEDSIFLGNIFDEYSKQLRNEPNKFQELMEKLK